MVVSIPDLAEPTRGLTGRKNPHHTAVRAIFIVTPTAENYDPESRSRQKVEQSREVWLRREGGTPTARSCAAESRRRSHPACERSED